MVTHSRVDVGPPDLFDHHVEFDDQGDLTSARCGHSAEHLVTALARRRRRPPRW
ncbi:hypothetical protein [Halomarina oriensis]|uniref:Uncharacterized protein n=1 Tax=Halomarina oriensis TaxID=671145 RepID=A0A6B0GGM0_9EURY|nr:hypothetical protein [Halomarina oriensis]MWG33107.1 hypothetical protein [Halomarina oriensis]